MLNLCDKYHTNYEKKCGSLCKKYTSLIIYSQTIAITNV